MKTFEQKQRAKSAIDLIEEAVQLLRTSPASVLAMYYIGSLPFALGILYFWTDMSRGSFARGHLAEASLGVAFLYLWMKCWQSFFACRLKSRLLSEEPSEFTFSRIFRLIMVQLILQPYGLLLIPFSLVLCFPFPWISALYHNLSVVGDDESADTGRVFKHAWKLACLWPAQNNIFIAILSLFTVIVFINVGITIFLIPELIRMLFGIETVFTLSGWHVLNTTFFAVVWVVTYLCINPLIKAVYVLRCFYGESLQSGADLKAELKSRQIRQVSALSAIVCIALILISGALIHAADESKRLSAPPQELNEEIGKVIKQREYQWRFPKEEYEQKDEGLFGEFFDVAYDWVSKWYRTIRDWYMKFRNWLRDLFPDSNPDPTTGKEAGFREEMPLMVILLTLAACILGIFAWRVWKRRRMTTIELTAAPVSIEPDITDENVAADQLPEEGWQAMARDLLQRGQLRPAIRALYMASLAHLAQCELVRIAKFKSNREYRLELQRRARDREPLLDAFSENVFLLERSWYGTHEVTEEVVSRFVANQDQIHSMTFSSNQTGTAE